MSRMTLTFVGGVSIAFLLDDRFKDTRAAGAVHGTPATPGPGGPRAVTDTDSKLSIGSGVVSLAPHSTPAWGDPGLWYGVVTRATGRVLVAQITPSSNSTKKQIGFSATTSSHMGSNGLYYNFAGGGILQVRSGASSVTVGIYTASQYNFAMVMAANGGYYFIKGANFSDGATWTLAFRTAAGSGNLYPAIVNNDGTFTSDYIRVLDDLWLPPIAAYDTFTRANGVLGSTETTGPDGQTVMAYAWESGGVTWAIVSNEAVNTPTVGSELVVNGDFAAWTADDPDSWTVTEGGPATDVTEVATGEAHAAAPTLGGGFCNIYRSGGGSGADPSITQTILTVGQWYLLSLDVDTATSGQIRLQDAGNKMSKTITSTGVSTHTGRATSAILRVRAGIDPTDMTFDDVSAKQLTLNTLFTDVDDGETSDYLAEVECDTIIANTQAGMVLSLDDKDAPANFVIAYHDGTNAILEKCVAGTYTGVISAAAAYGVGRVLKVHKQGTSFELFYNNAKIGSTSTISDAGIISNTKHGLFSTNSGNQLDKFTINYRTNAGYDAEFNLI